MKDGQIIQIGTPEDLVLHPATSYVAEFTRDVQRSKVMSAARLMTPATATALADHGGQVRPSDKVASFAAQIVSSRKPFGVVDDAGRMLGEVTPEAVINLLAGCDQPREVGP